MLNFPGFLGFAEFFLRLYRLNFGFFEGLEIADVRFLEEYAVFWGEFLPPFLRDRGLGIRD